MKQKYLFIDRDGTLIKEPEDEQVDSLEKLEFMPGVFQALSMFKNAGYQMVMVSNQDGLGSDSFPEKDFIKPHEMMLRIFQSQNIEFESIRICPHFSEDNCDCRKPKLGLLMDYLTQQKIDIDHSYVIGDRETDVQLANNLNLPGIILNSANVKNWHDVVDLILRKPRKASVTRTTKETSIVASINLDRSGEVHIATGIGFFDHMLEQLMKHAGFSGYVQASGDLHIDDHHTVEDTAIVMGQAIRKALGDKRGIARYGFVLPMDEAQACIAMDLSGRSYCQCNLELTREKVGKLATEMIPHFFKSFADALQVTLQIDVSGDNTHHMIEAAFKGVGRCLAQAVAKTGEELPSTKGVL